MKTSRILFACVILFSLCLSVVGMRVSYAESDSYYYIPKDAQAFFYTQKDAESNYIAKFKIPPTYYAKKRVHDEGLTTTKDGAYYLVEYLDGDNKIKGYLKTSEFFSGAGEPPLFNEITAPYFTNDPTNILKTGTAVVDIRSEPKNQSATVGTAAANTPLMFIGYIDGDAIEPQNSLWYYVKYGEIYGYVYAKNTNITLLTLTNHPNYETEDGVGGENPNDTKIVRNNLLETLLAIGIAIPAIVLIVLIFKPRGDSKRNNRKRVPPPQNQRRNNDYDDNDEPYDDEPRRNPPPPKGRNRY